MVVGSVEVADGELKVFRHVGCCGEERQKDWGMLMVAWIVLKWRRKPVVRLFFTNISLRTTFLS